MPAYQTPNFCRVDLSNFFSFIRVSQRDSATLEETYRKGNNDVDDTRGSMIISIIIIFLIPWKKSEENKRGKSGIYLSKI